jgi:hypothetical protein
MNLEEYRALTTRAVVCPSGAQAVIRKMTVGDFAKLLGIIPNLNIAKVADANVEDIDLEKVMAMQKTYLCRGVVSFAGGKVVEGETGDGVISWNDIATEDSTFLVNEIQNLSNPPRKVEGGAPEGARFPTS